MFLNNLENSQSTALSSDGLAVTFSEDNTPFGDWMLPGNESTLPLSIQPIREVDTLISDEAYYYFNNYVLQMSLSLISSVGIATNVINVIVYCKHVPRDGVTLTFIFLSVADTVSCAMSLLSVACFIIQFHLPIHGVSLTAVQYVYFGYTRGCAYVISTWLTVYLSVERCLCTIFPLRVKVILSYHRSLIIKISIVVFGIACFAPAWATQGMQVVVDRATNETHLDLWLASFRREVDLFVDTFNGVVVPTVAQVIVTICAFFIFRGIQSSAKFRQLVSGKRSNMEQVEDDFYENTPNIKTTSVMSPKEAKAAQVVVLVAVLFFVCNVPVLVVAYTRMLVTDLDFGKVYYKMYTVLYTIVYASGLINASVNIIVYYSASAKFKIIFLSLFCNTPTAKT